MTTADETVEKHEESIINPKWKSLYTIGGVAALVAAIVFRRWLAAEFGLLLSTGILNVGLKSQPTTVIEWFTLLESNSLIGLILLNVLDLINYALVGLIFLGLYAALRKFARGTMTLAIILAFTGIAIYFSSNQAFSLLSLSHQYSSATNDAQKSLFLAAGQALLIINNPAAFGTGVFWGFNLVNVSGLIISAVMLRSSTFSRTTAYTGILANVLGLGYFFTLAFVPQLVFIPLSASAPFLLIWYILIGVKLLKLARLKAP